MKITDSFTFNAPQQAVWDALMNPNAISSALPGVDALIPVEGEDMTWRATAKLGVANISGTYAGIVHMSEIDAPTQYRLTVSGEGQHSIINGSALLTLEYNAEDGKTILTYNAEAALSGKLAGIGQRLVGAAAKLLAKMFFGNLAKQLPTSPTSPAES
jgi:hypothetical protein